MRWTEILRPEGIHVPVENVTKEESLREILKHASDNGILFYPTDQILSILMEREKLISTGIGHGIALPHAKCEFCKEFIALLGVSKKGIDFDSADENPVHIVSIVIGPKDQPNKNIKLLARIARLLDQRKVREALINGKDAETIYRFLKQAEDQIEG